MICKVCGMEVEDNTKFCPFCGSPVEAPEPQAEAEAPAEAAAEAVAEAVEEDAEAVAAAPEEAAAAAVAAEGFAAQGPGQSFEMPQYQEPAPGAYTQGYEMPQYQEPAPGTYNQGYEQPQYQAPAAMATPPKEKKVRTPEEKKKLGMIAGIAGALVVLVIAAIFIIKASPASIDLEEYFTIEYSGYEGNGKATVVFDEAKCGQDIMEALADKGQIKGESMAELGSQMNLFAGAYTISEEVHKYSLDKSEGLKNGDKVTLTFDYDNDKVKPYKLKFKGDSISVTIEGLEEVQEFDAFEGFEITFTGVSGEGYAEMNKYDSDNYYYSMDKQYDLSNGDTVTVTVVPYSGDADFSDYAAEYGKAPKELTKEYKVEGLGEYITELSAIPDDLLDDMKAEAEDVILAHTSGWGSDKVYKSSTYVGMYFSTVKDSAKEGGWWYNFNKVYLVYKMEATDKYWLESGRDKNPDKNVTYYYFVGFRDIMKTGDEFKVDLSDSFTPYNSFDAEYNYYSGYETLGELKKNEMDTNAKDYTTETDIKE